MGQGLVRVDMILIGIVACPVKLESRQELQIVSILRNHRFNKELVTQAFGHFAIYDELTCDLAMASRPQVGSG